MRLITDEVDHPFPIYFGIIKFIGMRLQGFGEAIIVPHDRAQELLDICTAPDSHPDYLEAYGFCVGYFTGAMHYHRALARGPDHKTIVCPHHTVTRAEAIAVFVAWAKENPQYMSEEPIQAVMRAAVASAVPDGASGLS